MDIPKKPTGRLPALPDATQSTRASNGAGWERSPQKASTSRFFERRENFRGQKTVFYANWMEENPCVFFWGGGHLLAWILFFLEPLKISGWKPKNEGLEDDFPFQTGDVQVPSQFSRVFPKTSSHTNKKDVTPPKKTKLRRGSRSWSIHIKYIKVCVFKKSKKLIPYESFGTHLSSVQNVWLTFHWILIDNIGSLCLLQSP